MPVTLLDPDAPEPVGWRGSVWSGLALRWVLSAIVAGLLCAGPVPAAMASDTCVNAAVRAQNNSSGLPDCRGYEMVSAPYKEGFPVDPGGLTFTDDGIFSYRSIGNIAGNARGLPINQYHATRTAAGWSTTALSPPDVIYDTQGSPTNESSDLRSSLWSMTRRDVPGDRRGFYRRSSEGVFTRIGDAEDASGPRERLGWSADFSHVLFRNFGNENVLYETVAGGDDAIVRPVSVDNDGQEALVACFKDVSADGRVIVYGTGCSGSSPQLWARVAGAATIAVSGSECTRGAGDAGGACNAASAATYAGGAADGSRVFFTTRQQLVNGDTDTGSPIDQFAGNDLYACDIPAGVPVPVGAANRCASLTRVSGTGSSAKVENVVTVSQDGSRAYFVAQGVLANNLGVGGVGAATGAGAHNLYLWERDAVHPAGETRFVARLSDPPAGNGNDVARAHLTPDGRYLLFLTASKLVTAGLAADTDDAVDAYRYDSVTNTVVRVSTSVSGGGGNDPASDVSLIVQATSVMTADGSTVIFDTAEPLSPDDADGVTDVYSWRDGQVSRISTGGGNAAGITASGHDIFFLTNVPLLVQDRDFNADVYDARVGGGFPVTQSSPCSGDACRGLRSQPPSLAVPSPGASGGPEAVAAPPAFTLRRVSLAQRRLLAAKGMATLSVTANVPGTVSVKATATIGGRSMTVGSARRILEAPGRVSVALTLSKKARGQLAARGRLTVRVAVSHSKVALDRSAVLKLVHAKSKPKAKRATKRVPARQSAGQGGGRS